MKSNHQKLKRDFCTIPGCPCRQRAAFAFHRIGKIVKPVKWSESDSIEWEKKRRKLLRKK